MKYYIGMDGGGTKTSCVVAADGNSVLYRTAGGSTNYLARGMETACMNILDIIDECCKELKISYEDIEKILIGAAGAGRKDDAAILINGFTEFCGRKNIKFNSFEVESDAAVALEGAFSGKPGFILIAGTGSIIYGKDDNGSIFRSGGFGRIIGDEGGGYSIGRKALQALSRSFDGRSEMTELVRKIQSDHGIVNGEDLINKVYKTEFNIASVALSVIKAAETGDDAAKKILDEESSELVLLVKTMSLKIKTGKTGLCLLGSLIDNDNFYSAMLKKKITDNFSNIELKKPDSPPEFGAILLARRSKFSN